MPAPIKPSLSLSPTTIYDALILGAGPAGLATALTLCRVKRTTAIFSTNTFRNERAARAHTILSRDHEPASEIRRIGKQQIEVYGTTNFVERGIVHARKDDKANVFEVEDDSGEKWRGRKIVLAMGASDVFPTDVPGYETCWGEGIFQCLFCDGIERSDRPAGVLGFDSPMGLHQVLFCFNYDVPSVTIFANGKVEGRDEATAEALEVAKAKGARVDERGIEKLVLLEEGEGVEICFVEGGSTRVGFLAHTPPTEANGKAVAEALGVEVLSDGRGGTLLKRNEPFGESNVSGVFVAGDGGTIVKQFTLAMAAGVAAGGGVAIQLNGEEEGRIRKELERDGKIKPKAA